MSKFCLYLRPFEFDNTTSYYRWSLGSLLPFFTVRSFVDIHPNTFEEAMLESLSPKTTPISIGGSFSSGGPGILNSDTDWQQDFLDLAPEAIAIFCVPYFSFWTAWELKMLMREKNQRVVLINPPVSADNSEMRKNWEISQRDFEEEGIFIPDTTHYGASYFLDPSGRCKLIATGHGCLNPSKFQKLKFLFERGYDEASRMRPRSGA